MKTRFLTLTLTVLMSVCLGAYALDPAEPVQDEKAPAAVPECTQVPAPEATDASVQVRNNTLVAIYVSQPGSRQATVNSKCNWVINDLSAGPISVRPVSGTSGIKYVTLTPKKGTCESASCLIVQ
ncbi:hypothetical protein CBI55_13140 [Pseudomonas syringae]|uniref:hypothetical protein n=1 Tax=Pseudomonas syringae TaxID=317 RepID=UPI000C1C921B|nr:hypothetical protein [Pseudomonas syringae]PIO93648.1 hypothetical protein CBI55_13140 [Pseudomonas syringae]POP81966.1 hypothetical protein CXB38_10960 [Pseudomonas syringae]